MYTPVVALQGEIGTSSVRSRDMKNKLKLAVHLLTAGNSQMACFGQWQQRSRRREAANGQNRWRDI